MANPSIGVKSISSSKTKELQPWSTESGFHSLSGFQQALFRIDRRPSGDPRKRMRGVYFGAFRVVGFGLGEGVAERRPEGTEHES